MSSLGPRRRRNRTGSSGIQTAHTGNKGRDMQKENTGNKGRDMQKENTGNMGRDMQKENTGNMGRAITTLNRGNIWRDCRGIKRASIKRARKSTSIHGRNAADTVMGLFRTMTFRILVLLFSVSWHGGPNYFAEPVLAADYTNMYYYQQKGYLCTVCFFFWVFAAVHVQYN